MNSTKITNTLLLVLVLLFAIHVAVETLWLVGRYVWAEAGSDLSVLDTSNGTLYHASSTEGMTMNIVRRANPNVSPVD